MSSKENNKILMKHNDIVNAKYEITVNSNRVFTYLLYAFQKDLDKSKLTCDISRKELASLVNGNVDKTIKGLTTILMNLRKKDLFLMDELDDGSIDFIAGGFIDNVTYNNKSDKFNIVADTRVHKLLHRYLEDGYTPINLEIWLSLKNRYSQRLYDLLRAWTGTKKTINYPINKLRELLLLENKYKQYTDFRKRVLLPAVEELNSTGYFDISFVEVKKGRTVDSIDFLVNDLDKRKYFNNDSDLVKEIYNMKKSEKNNKENPKIDQNGNNITLDNNKEYPKNELESNISDFFVPDNEIFTKGTLRSFKKDFMDIDFKNKYMEKAFDESVMIVFDKDDVENIKALSYKFFKSTLDNKIKEYMVEEQKEEIHQLEMDKFW